MRGKQMVFVIGFPILFVIFGWHDIFRYADSFVDYVALGVFTLFLASIPTLLGVGLAALLGCVLPKKWQESGTAKLTTMRDVNSINGSFLLGTGSIESKQYYFFYKEQDGGFAPDKVEVSDNVMIYEEEREYGTLKSFSKEFSNPFFWLFVYGVSHHKKVVEQKRRVFLPYIEKTITLPDSLFTIYLSEMIDVFTTDLKNCG